RGNAGDARLARHRFHLIEAGRFTAALSPESKGKTEIEMLNYLHTAARPGTEKWLARHRASVGWKSTVDLAKHFLAPRGAAADPLARAASDARSPTEAA